MRELFLEYLQEPKLAEFLTVRSALIESDNYNPYSKDMDGIDDLLEAGDFDQAREILEKSMPNLLLSPEAHLALAYIAENVGDDETAKMESYVASACAEGILLTGEGTRAKPYLVVRTSDEHDIVLYLEKTPTHQELVETGEKRLDRIQCDDGTELWFDISEAYSKLHDKFDE